MRRLLLQQLSRLVSTRQAGNHVQCRNMNLKATKKDVQAIAHERVPVQDVRNFSIVSHIDAGKSTLSDALMARCGAIDTSKANSQFLDRLQVERERGITVKAQAASVLWNEHLFNLIDTPGHVDFSGEVARSLKACDGVLLLVDATQGVQAQTVTNLYLALEADLPVVPVLNKCDAATADITGSSQQMVSICGVQPDEIICVSAKHGTGIDNVLDAVQNRIPAPLVHENSSTARALLLDSFYNSYRGAITLALVKDGSIQAGSRIASLSTGEQHTVAEVGMFTPDATVTRSISAARLGYLVTGARSPQAARIGDTICSPPEAMQTAEPLASLPSTKPSVWQGIFPSSSDEYEKLRRGIAQLTMNDASVSVDHESSEALGLGFRAGFLGVLHADVFRQRLQEETGIHVICTAPTVPYQCRPRKEGAEWQTVRNPSQLEEIKHYEGTSVEMQEPVVEATILLPSSRLGAVLNLASEYRAKALEQSFLSSDRVLLRYDVPLSEMPPFTEKLKQITSGATLPIFPFIYLKT